MRRNMTPLDNNAGDAHAETDDYSSSPPPRNAANDDDGISSSEPLTISTQSIEKPLFSAGVIADIQYAPIPDGFSFTGTKRFYRHALEAARHAARHYEEEKVDILLNLGDTVDGKCQEIGQHGGEPVPEDVDPGMMSLEHVLDALSEYKSGRIVHTYGNHCLYNLDRQQLRDKLGLEFVEEPCGDFVGYSHFSHKGVRFVVIDCYDIALMQRCEITSKKHKKACEILASNNPNYPENINSPEGLEGLQRRFVGFNGGVGEKQLEWIRRVLKEARDVGEKAIILSHQPIHPESSNPVCLVWNYEEILEILRDFSDVVVASFSGHAHKGGYVKDESGIHFRVVEAALENCPEKTYGILDVHSDRLELRGYGNCESAVYKCDLRSVRMGAIP
jgi:manganese-dependent ADP-ribose/CDP-alcohol diphosphatase